MMNSALNAPICAPQKGYLITFEGIDGSGKSTQCCKVNSRLSALVSSPIVVTHEPGGSFHGQAIRELILSGAIERSGPIAETFLFFAARYEHMLHCLCPALEEGAIVLCDRFADSTRAYQIMGCAPEVRGHLNRVHDTLLGSCVPDLTVLLDLDPRHAYKTSGCSLDRFERESLGYFDRVRAHYLQLAEAEPARFLTLNARMDQDVITSRIIERIRHLIESKPDSNKTVPPHPEGVHNV